VCADPDKQPWGSVSVTRTLFNNGLDNGNVEKETEENDNSPVTDNK
jgi:hypothetical protein